MPEDSFASKTRTRCLCWLALLGLGCGNAPTPTPLFPPDYASSYREVRDCRRSADHDLNFVRVLADPVAYDPYLSRTEPFPLESLLVKEEYDDSTCTKLVGLTAMKREATGGRSVAADWRFQRVKTDGSVREDSVLRTTRRCEGCHQNCGQPPDGFDGTCAAP